MGCTAHQLSYVSWGAVSRPHRQVSNVFSGRASNEPEFALSLSGNARIGTAGDSSGISACCGKQLCAGSNREVLCQHQRLYAGHQDVMVPLLQEYVPVCPYLGILYALPSALLPNTHFLCGHP